MSDESSKNISFAAYVPVIGWVVAYGAKMLTADHSRLTIFHLRQGLGLTLLEFVAYLVIQVVFDCDLVWQIVVMLFIVYTMIGFTHAYRGNLKPLPLIGRWFDSLFRIVD